MPVTEYDVIIGTGSGLNILGMAVEHGLKTAISGRGPIGGTYLNAGCIPSKMLIFTAGRIKEIRESAQLGVAIEIKRIDFGAIMERMRKLVDGDRMAAANGIDGQNEVIDHAAEEQRNPWLPHHWTVGLCPNPGSDQRYGS